MTLPSISGNLLNFTIGSYTSVTLSSAVTIGTNGSVTLGTSSNLYLNGYTLSSSVSVSSVITVTGASAASSIIYGGVDASTSGTGRISIWGGSDAVRSTISNLTFTKSTNSSVRINAEGYANITNCTFTGNSATNGGAINIGGTGDLTLSSSTFTNNTATSDGGAIYNFGSLSLNGGNIDFSGNTAVTNSKAIYNAITLNVSGGMNVRDISAVPDQQIYNATAKTITLTGDATFTNFTITNDGTASLVIGAHTLTLNNTTITGTLTGSATSNLSIIGSHKLTGNITLYDLTLGDASKLYLDGKTLFLTHSATGYATSPTSIIYGGVDADTAGIGLIKIGSGIGTLAAPVTISTLTIAKCSDSATHIDTNAYLSISNCIYTYNVKTAAGTMDGGAIYVAEDGANGGHLTVSNTEFTHNSVTANPAAENHGGAIWVGNNATASVSNCTFSYNSANYGGDIKHYWRQWESYSGR
jgi:predicted outer membrane repeat protein